MAFLFFKKYIIAAFFILAIGIGLIYHLYKYIFRPYHLKVSDTGYPYLVLDPVGFDDQIIVYTTDNGRSIYLRCSYGESIKYSDNHPVPKGYPTPYHYIYSGRMDQQIRQLRIDTDLKEARRTISPSIIESPNYKHLNNVPIKFKDVGDEVRRRLGVR